MLILKHLKTLRVSVIIQIIFRELVGSLLKSLNLKGRLWWCGNITFDVHAWRSVWGGMVDWPVQL